MGSSSPHADGPSPPPPPAHGVRLDWQATPERVRSAFEQWAGCAVVHVATQPTGFSPGVAARLRLADGRQVFVKAIGPRPNPDSPSMHRREARIVDALPMTAPVPRLLWSYDEGDGGWVALVFENVDGQQPAQPWDTRELERVVDALAAMAASLTPSPLPAAVVSSASAALGGQLRGWQPLREEPAPKSPAWTHGRRAISTRWPTSSARLSLLLRVTRCCTSMCVPTTCCSPLIASGLSTGPTRASARRGSMWCASPPA